MIVLLAPTGCYGPAANANRVAAIAVEAHGLMQLPQSDWESVSDRRLPPTIASLHPDFISISPKGVDIVTTALFDGG
ncbi:hypothetical protein [Sphingomonas sp. Leaf33]|uniref:hypothetical protein n=1 Tax=Sphingomonas sp. Leaf33 TaxID=1736215 RepID=UPI0012E14760|nr:hypothetical protein [Sphingomonas sp. Leaf33]